MNDREVKILVLQGFVKKIKIADLLIKIEYQNIRMAMKWLLWTRLIIKGMIRRKLQSFFQVLRESFVEVFLWTSS